MPAPAQQPGPLAVAVVLEALVILFDELLIASGELLFDRAIDRVTILVAEVAPRALRPAALQPLHGVRIDPLAAAARIAPLFALALSLAVSFAPLALALLLAAARTATLAVAFALFGLFDELGQDFNDLVLLLAGLRPCVLKRQLAAAELHAERNLAQRPLGIQLQLLQLAERADPHSLGGVGIKSQKLRERLGGFLVPQHGHFGHALQKEHFAAVGRVSGPLALQIGQERQRILEPLI